MVRRPPGRAQFDVTTLSKVLVSLLFLVALAAAVSQVLAGDFATDSLLTSVASLYVTGTLAVGVLRGATATRRWQAAFFGGLVVFSLAQYLTSGDRFHLLSMVAGAAMILGLLFDVFPE
ncbi:hypothetical protein [Halorussus sp. MSC15.2]|uniref:hypothetical protein n=1 Tax=Halorussus sp. MSC15.2 TaxID=2283638 RepID=UPI0013D02183|nr:hypothetical protein [Halorussus sp. MSC15.2]NEU55818.1 hypothetical protein [Halorussus sp. MSC15.2]